jgi:hypothetical protein
MHKKYLLFRAKQRGKNHRSKERKLSTKKNGNLSDEKSVLLNLLLSMSQGNEINELFILRLFPSFA